MGHQKVGVARMRISVIKHVLTTLDMLCLFSRTCCVVIVASTHESDRLGSEDMERATSSTSKQPDSDAVTSLLQRLRSPIPSALSRKRSMKINLPTGSKHGKGRCVADPKSVSVSNRVKAYPGENFFPSNKLLFGLPRRDCIKKKCY